MLTVIFFGTPHFSVPTLKGLIEAPDIEVGAVVTQPDKPVGRGRTLQAPPIKELACAHSIPVYQPTSLKKEFSQLRSDLDKLGPFDIGVVVAFGQILPASVLSYPKHGCINIHASLLPRWRGAAPIHRAIEAGDSETGICLMHMDEGLDTGPVFASATTPINTEMTTQDLHATLSILGSELLLQKLHLIASGSVKAVPQKLDGVTYARKISSQEAKIDWSLSSEQISDKVRAFYPFPGCYTHFHNKRLKILKAAALDKKTSLQFSSLSQPGAVLNTDNGQMLIGCGEGVLRVERIKIEGKREMDMAEFLRGTSVPNGLLMT